MNKLSLFLRGLAVAGGLAAAVVWFLTNGRLDELQGQLNTSQQRLQVSQADLAEARDNIAALSADLTTSRNDLALSKQRATEFQDQYFLAAQEVTRLQNQIQQKETRMARLLQDNEQLQREIVTVRSAPSPERDRTPEIANYQRRIADLESEIRDLQSRLIGAPILASRETEPPPELHRQSSPPNFSSNPPPEDGRRISATIAAVRPDRGLLVFDQGLQAGIRPDEEFVVMKNGTEVGRLRVTAINQLGSAGTWISSTDTGNTLNIGDSIWLIQ